MILCNVSRVDCPVLVLCNVRAGVLVKHIRCHTNERPYSCSECAIAFKTKSNLYKHCKSKAHLEKLQQLAAAGRLPLHTVLNIGPAAGAADTPAAAADPSVSVPVPVTAPGPCSQANGAPTATASSSSTSSSSSSSLSWSSPAAVGVGASNGLLLSPDALLGAGAAGGPPHVSAIAPALQSSQHLRHVAVCCSPVLSNVTEYMLVYCTVLSCTALHRMFLDSSAILESSRAEP